MLLAADRRAPAPARPVLAARAPAGCCPRCSRCSSSSRSGWRARSARRSLGFASVVAGAVLYVSNWQLIFQHVSYFARFGPPSPLNHLWSLGIEEQFYIVWPLVLLVAYGLFRERSRVPGTATAARAAHAAPGRGLRHRDGDALPAEPRPLAGLLRNRHARLRAARRAPCSRWCGRAACSGRRSRPARGGSSTALGASGCSASPVLVWSTNQYSAFLYRGGFVLLTVATAFLIAALVHPATRLGPLLGVGVLRWIGVRSYGHLPLAHADHRADDAGRRPRHRPLAHALQVAATILVAALSWRYLEQPIRHGIAGAGLAGSGVPARAPSAAARRRRPGPRDRSCSAPRGDRLARRDRRRAHRGEQRRARVPPRRAPRRTVSVSVSPQATGPPRGRQGRDGGPESQLLRVGRRRRRLDLGGPDLAELPARPGAPDRGPASTRSGRPIQHYEYLGGDDRSSRPTTAMPNATQVAEEWQHAGYAAVGCSRSARTTRPTCTSARASPRSRGSSR